MFMPESLIYDYFIDNQSVKSSIRWFVPFLTVIRQHGFNINRQNGTPQFGRIYLHDCFVQFV